MFVPHSLLLLPTDIVFIEEKVILISRISSCILAKRLWCRHLSANTVRIVVLRGALGEVVPCVPFVVICDLMCFLCLRGLKLSH